MQETATATTETNEQNVLQHYNKDLHKANYEQIKKLSQLAVQFNQIILEMRFSNDTNPVMKEHFAPILDLAYAKLETYNAIPNLLAARMKAIEQHVFFNSFFEQMQNNNNHE